jgi:hypothetical protein
MKRAIVMLSCAFFPAQFLAQTAPPSFDAASIKTSRSSDDSPIWNSSPGYLVMKNQTLNARIRIAYGLNADTRDAASALAERFQLMIHRDSKLVSGYELVVAKKGLKIHTVEPSGGHRVNWGKGQVLAERVCMPWFADALARMLSSPVPATTGVSGEFQFQGRLEP